MGRKRDTVEFDPEVVFNEMDNDLLEQWTIGLPFPSLSLRYVHQSTVYPLSRMVIAAGKDGTGKSAYLSQVFSWIRQAGGKSYLAETEDKDSMVSRDAILGYDPEATKVRTCELFEEAAEFLKKKLSTFQAACDGTKASPGPGRLVPMGLGLDSLTAVVGEETRKKYEKDGYGRGYPIEPLMIAQFLRDIMTRLYGWPIALVCTNHAKQAIDSSSNKPVFHMPGGRGPRFHATYILEFTRTKDIPTNAAGYSGTQIRIKAEKNSLGSSRKAISVDLLWTTQMTDDGMAIRRGFWDWDSATINLLLFLQQKMSKKQWSKIAEVFDIHTKSTGAGGVRCWSEALNIPSSDPLPFRLAAQELEKNKEVMKVLHAVMGIEEFSDYRPKVEFLEQLDEALVLAKARRERISALPKFNPDAETLETASEPEEAEEENEPVESDF